MGCDIHFYVEKKINGVWKSADTWTKDEDDDSRMRVPYGQELYRGRNYNLFSILANVRNGRGFAGVKTGEGFNPISEPRGLPSDTSTEVRTESEHWGSDGHSRSHLTVREILDFDWSQETRLCGVVDADNFCSWKHSGSPQEWSGSVMGENIIVVSNDAMQSMIDLKDPRLQKTGFQAEVFTEVQWGRKYHECAGSFPCTIMRALNGTSPENVRFVFWFDN